MFVCHVLTSEFFFTMGEFDYVFVCMFYFCLLVWSIMLVSNNILQNESRKIAPTTSILLIPFLIVSTFNPKIGKIQQFYK